ncbi:lipopolysaccharide biosynthesis protein [Intrasporangium sp. YIM S08009]|uniref:lipopolysaccharide biosynthesis protein n=1 Tax=Intrasporangium zincisolvens TaxID=3080018 RepID=UPI002B05E480|nr:oligosaccharide flippase family protein [Intrasporangium sp. YIM S08009]
MADERESPVTDTEPSVPGAPAASGSLGAHSVVYLVGTALQGLGVLLVLPFATRVLGATEFGQVATGLVVVQMVGTIAAAGLPQVILREHHRGAEGPRVARALAGTMVLLGLGLGVVGLAVALVLSAAGHADLAQWLPLVVASVGLTTVVSGQTLMRARLQPWGFLALAVLATVGAQLAGVVAARVDRSAATYLTAYASVVVLAAVLALVLGRPLPPTVERARVRAGVRLAAPLLPQAVAMLGLLSGDVLLTGWLVGTAAAGEYQVALQLGNMPFVLAVALFNAWGPLVLSRPLADRWAWTARTGTALTTVVGAGAAGVALLGPWLVAVMAAPSFDRAAIVTALGVVSTVAVAYMVYQGSSLAVLDVERTGRLAWAALAALAVLVAAAWLLTSKAGLGLVGVAVAKALAYVVLMAVTTGAAVRHSPLRWPGRLVVVAVASVVLALVGAFLPAEGVGLWLRAGLAVLVAGAALALAPGVLRSLRG